MIRSSLRFIFKTIYGLAALVGCVVIGISLFAAFKESTPPIPDQTYLTLSLKGQYTEHNHESVINSLLAGKSRSLYTLTSTLYAASDDKRIKGLVIYGEGPTLGFAQTQELRQAILAFRAKGKKVAFYADTFGYGESGNSLYYLATACDEIWIQPMGTVGLTGLEIQTPFGRKVFDQLGILPEFFHRKEYKSYPEMFTNSEPSPENLEALQAIADSYLTQMVEGIAKGRNLPPETVRNLINNGPFPHQQAITEKLINGVAYRNNIDFFAGFVGIASYSFANYAKHLQTKELPKGNKVALVIDSGAIMRADQGGAAQGETINNHNTQKAIWGAINDPDVKAIVYRINSPGGDPTASQTILSAITSAKEKGKPVVVSMSDAAASGGYWASCNASRIVAHPGTLTGSIGAFMGKFSLAGLWEKIGVKWDGVKAGENGGIWSINHPFTPNDMVKLNAYIDDIYQRFVDIVAKGRNLTPDKVEKVAKGRVWTGEQAQALGLVDQLGDLHDAIALARQLGKIDAKAPVEVFPKPKTTIEKIMVILNGDEDEDENTALMDPKTLSFLRIIQMLLMAPQAYNPDVASIGQTRF